MEAYGFYLILFFVFLVFVGGGIGSIIHFIASADSRREANEEHISRVRGDAPTSS